MPFKYLIFSLLILTWSCTTNVDLGSVYEKRVVVEGEIQEDSIATIQLSQTVSATDEDLFPAVENAVIQLSDSEGNTEILTEETPGFYRGNLLKGILEETYFLTIQSDNKEYTATTKMPLSTVELTDITLATIDIDPAGFLVQTVLIHFNKMMGDSIYCQFDVYRNEIKSGQSVFYKSEMLTEQDLSLPLFTFSGLQTGDLIRVECHQIEEWQYEYLNSIKEKGEEEIISGLLIGPPDNLTGNIEGSGLGYFGAKTRSILEFIMP